MKRPDLNKALDSREFREFYYLKEELVSFCRECGLPVSGGKPVLTERIAYYLDTGKVITECDNKDGSRTNRNDIRRKSREKDNSREDNITLDSLLGDNYVCSEEHRLFFEQQVGKNFSYKVPFLRWLKSNGDKTYRDAIDKYNDIVEQGKNSLTTIDKQFEYNTYIRDFYGANKGKSLEDAIKCWKYKKSLRGHNRYEDTDLVALSDNGENYDIGIRR